MTGAKTFSTVGDVLQKFNKNEDKYISREFQKYAYGLARELNDLEHKSLYMRLAKNTPRPLLEVARSFVKDAYQVKSKARLFMWKLAKLKSEKVDTQEGRR
ncbi:MAG: hypothetical protein UT39_C0002G0062 [Candidatus Woesebacteria bacterium GW2011_GWA1_39_21]|uniref:Uncharacterized protein n=1 Tax=Candidatus Woesebacteria bacterium GW2011_GWA1_39_21 TaxID=1618550 RepID=A0A0G0NGD6_9BACT|nr:MAG: hypothetical protein UT39_C0002G0062 [Candidatus Woesebacteria bacterium GW2011_GWA1_39_21]